MKYFLTLFTWFLLGSVLNNLSGCEHEGANTTARASPQQLDVPLDFACLAATCRGGLNDENC